MKIQATILSIVALFFLISCDVRTKGRIVYEPVKAGENYWNNRFSAEGAYKVILENRSSSKRIIFTVREDTQQRSSKNSDWISDNPYFKDYTLSPGEQVVLVRASIQVVGFNNQHFYDEGQAFSYKYRIVGARVDTASK